MQNAYLPFYDYIFALTFFLSTYIVTFYFRALATCVSPCVYVTFCVLVFGFFASMYRYLYESLSLFLNVLFHLKVAKYKYFHLVHTIWYDLKIFFCSLRAVIHWTVNLPALKKAHFFSFLLLRYIVYVL